MALSFAHLWQQQASSDMDVVLLAPAVAEEAGEQQGGVARPAMLELASFPAHSTLLSNSDVLWCRVLRWQDKRPCTRASKRARTSSSNNSNSTEQTTRGRLELELQDASEQEAALAVLQSLYAVKPLPELLAELTQEQQLQAALLADKWQVPHVSSAAAELLADAAKQAALAEAVQQRVLQDPALPDCLQPLLKSVVLSLLGDLEAAWADEGLQQQLLGLPLPAMELLLSCDELKVASEDTVLYTLQQYLDSCSDDEWQHARQVLAPLVRCQHLSQFWLAMSVDSTQPTTALAELRSLLVKLLVVRSAQPAAVVQPPDLQRLLKDAPPSWALGRRHSRPLGSVSMTWNVSIATLRETATRCVAENKVQGLVSPAVTAPLGGLTFSTGAICVPEGTGCKLAVYVRNSNLPDGTLCPPFRYRLVASGHERASAQLTRLGQAYRGFVDFFGLGAMAGGWDEAAVAAKGLPTSGDLPITLTVSEVAHMERVPDPAQAGARQRRR